MEQPLEDYVDFNVHNTVENNEIISGICHKKASNSKTPAQWLNYVIVDNLEKSLENCINLGGKYVGWPKGIGKGFICSYPRLSQACLALMQELQIVSS